MITTDPPPQASKQITVRFDPRTPDASAAAIGRLIASLVIGAPNEHDDEQQQQQQQQQPNKAQKLQAAARRLMLDDVDATHQLRILLAVSRAVYVARRRRCVRTQYLRRPHGFGSVEFFGVVDEATATEAAQLSASALFSADLQNIPSNLTNPSSFAKRIARAIASHHDKTLRANNKVRATVLSRRQLQQQGLGLVLGVGDGSVNEPCMLVLELRHRAAAAKGGRPPRRPPLVAMVGKGVLYDAGGMSLKPTQSMYGMHGDKSGAAIVAAAIRYLAHSSEWAARGVDVVAALPLVENLVSGNAVRPGDVLTACNGTTVEVVDPDAEGRLILADAIAYLGKAYSPDAVVDVATLTGLSDMIHPSLAAVGWCEDAAVFDAVCESGERAGERIWRLPPWPHHGAQLESASADTRNAGWSVAADTYMASLFIRQFLPPGMDPARWFHIDLGVLSNTGAPLDGTGVVLCVAAVRAMATTLTQPRSSFPRRA